MNAHFHTHFHTHDNTHSCECGRKHLSVHTSAHVFAFEYPVASVASAVPDVAIARRTRSKLASTLEVDSAKPRSDLLRSSNNAGKRTLFAEAESSKRVKRMYR